MQPLSETYKRRSAILALHQLSSLIEGGKDECTNERNATLPPLEAARGECAAAASGSVRRHRQVSTLARRLAEGLAGGAWRDLGRNGMKRSRHEKQRNATYETVARVCGKNRAITRRCYPTPPTHAFWQMLFWALGTFDSVVSMLRVLKDMEGDVERKTDGSIRAYLPPEQLRETREKAFDFLARFCAGEPRNQAR